MQAQPENLEMRIQLAGTYLAQFCFRDAIRHLQAVREERPQMPVTCWLYLAISVQAISGYLAKSNMFLRRALRLVPLLLAFWAPLYISIPIGVFLGVYFVAWIVLFVSFGGLESGGKRRRSGLVALVGFVAYSMLYWGLVYLGRIV